jgi:hypothetical protein
MLNHPWRESFTEECAFLLKGIDVLVHPVPLTKLYMGSVVDSNSTGYMHPGPDSEVSGVTLKIFVIIGG